MRRYKKRMRLRQLRRAMEQAERFVKIDFYAACRLQPSWEAFAKDCQGMFENSKGHDGERAMLIGPTLTGAKE